MIFNAHSRLVGEHAFLSASKSSWLRYDEDKLARVFNAMLAARRGTELHNIAADLIRLGIKLPRSKKSLNSYVNDALGYRMTPEQVLFFSDNIFGTTDAISFRDDLLRIFDLKTGISPAGFDQLMIYAAIFCLEYKVRPFDIRMEFRIYQNDEVKILEGDPIDILQIMDQIKHFDRKIEEWKLEGLG
jgi:hypothetical protein